MLKYIRTTVIRKVFSVFTRPLFVKHPQTSKAKDLFYCRPLTNYTKDGTWYSEQPREKHTLSDMIKKLCEQAGIEGKFTNHSLRASEATTLFQSDAPEKVIQEFTGHRSVKALRQYKKVASKHKRKLPVIF